MATIQEPENVIIHADEVDEPPPPPEAFAAAAQDHPVPALQPTAQLTIERPNTVQPRVPASTPTRSVLSRDTTVPQAQETWIDLQFSQPPQDFTDSNAQQHSGLWNPQGVASSEPMDSLSLGQLRKIVHEMPKLEPAPYAFEYQNVSSFAEELEELFDYSWEERSSLLRVQTTFARLWADFVSSSISAPDPKQTDWCSTDESLKTTFLERLKSNIDGGDDADKMESLESVVYLALGCWYETAGLDQPVDSNYSPEDPVGSDTEYRSSTTQVKCIKANILLINRVIPPQVFFNIFHSAYDPQVTSRDERDTENYGIDTHPDLYQQRERWLTNVLLYLVIDLAARGPESELTKELRKTMAPIQLKMLVFLTDLFARSRWEDNDVFPSSKLLLLYWKLILLTFGNLTDVENIKNVLAGKSCHDTDVESEGPLITASPLDYHVFRQEIMSKYPAYNPPPPLFPFEHDHNSFLPTLQDSNGKNTSSSSAAAAATMSNAGPASIPGAGTSIMNQPVHIATPAPSPPPSPAGPGGKGLKKQNYQTNQMFPFLYPPLSESSNDLGGKGSTELQDLFAGRKWQGSDIPASILEAAHLFSKRMRATRAMKQLWAERVRFMKYEQSYSSHEEHHNIFDKSEDQDDSKDEDDIKILDDESKRKLLAVEEFYKISLSSLQSLIIVLLKTLLQNITTLITQSDSLEGIQGNNQSAEPDSNEKPATQQEVDGINTAENETEDNTTNTVINTRTQEIMGKAVSGILILLLKWFKLSHILKFEYVSQLLLDSNYIQFVLKLFSHQELERAVTYKCEIKEFNFLTFCRANSRNAKPPELNGSDLEDDFDDAVPPPISLTSQQASRSAVRLDEIVADSEKQPTSFSQTPAPTQPPPRPPAPEVDELGYPLSTLPAEPITNYSWRTFYTAINYLRILQKVVKSKPHRQLLMVQGKYSNTLKKHLKVPQSDVRLYTLKIIKGQVPYCHRKWRQGNMRIITAIYLHVKPGLRDEWLSGLDMEQEVGEALPAEQALRALTYWYNLRNYPDEMGTGNSDSDLASEIGSALALSDLDLDVDFGDTARVDTSELDFRDTRDGHSTDLQGVKVAAALESTCSRVLQEQDFFLRELEKMDLGLSFYGVPSSALSPLATGPASPQQPSAPVPSPPSTRVLPMPEIVSTQLENELIAESPSNSSEANNSGFITNSAFDSARVNADEELDQDSIQQVSPTSSKPQDVDRSSTVTTSLLSPTNDALETGSSTLSDGFNDPDDADVIVIAKDDMLAETPLDTAAFLDGNRRADPKSMAKHPVDTMVDSHLVESPNDDADDENEDDDGDIIADEDVEEGENMVLTR